MGYYVSFTKPILVLCYAYVLSRLGLNRGKLTPLMLYFLPALFAVFNGLARGNELVSIVADIVHSLSGGLALAIALRIFQLCTLQEVLELFRRGFSSWIKVAAACFALFIVLRSIKVIHYPGFANGHMGFATILWSALGQRRAMFLGWIIILCSGSRNNLLSLLGSLGIRRMVFDTSSRRLRLVAMGGGALMILVGLALQEFSLKDLEKVDIPTLQKFSNFSTEKYDLDSAAGWYYYSSMATAGRWEEIVGASGEFVNDPTVALIGKGFGATYFCDYPPHELPLYPPGKHRNVHFSYLGVALLHGVFSFFYLGLAGVALFRIRRNRGEEATNRKVAFQAIVFQLLSACFNITFFPDLILWFFTGYGLSLNTEKKETSKT